MRRRNLPAQLAQGDFIAIETVMREIGRCAGFTLAHLVGAPFFNVYLLPGSKKPAKSLLGNLQIGLETICNWIYMPTYNLKLAGNSVAYFRYAQSTGLACPFWGGLDQAFRVLKSLIPRKW